MKNLPNKWYDITTIIDNIEYTGSYKVYGDDIFVEWDFHAGSTQVGGHVNHEAVLAKMILGELVRKYR